MRSMICFLLPILLVFGCSTYQRTEECEPESCDGLDNDCDGFVDETRFECPDGSLVAWCSCDANQNFECLENPGDSCRDSHCDDGTEPLCEMEPPECLPGEILAWQNYCYECVDPKTCEPPGCQAGEVRTYACPDGSLVDWCHCNQEGRWDCVEEPGSLCRDTHCDDGTPVQCLAPVPECNESEILAYQNYCYACVNPVSCHPWGIPGCQEQQDCPPDQFCDFCATSSCPECDDCLAACQPHGCPTETELTCYCTRPECSQGGVSVIQDGCWICVSQNACVPTGEGC